jgi:hypothetical protein
MKRILNEATLHQIITESIKKILLREESFQIGKKELRKLQSLKNKVMKFNEKLQAYFDLVEDNTLPDVDTTIIGYSPMELIQMEDIENGFVATIDGEPVTVQYVLDEGEIWLTGDDELDDYLKYENRRINKGIRIWKSENPDFEESIDDDDE